MDFTLQYINNKAFNSTTKLFKLQLLLQHYEPSLLLNGPPPKRHTHTLKTKALRLASKEEQVKRLLVLYKRLIQPYLSLLRR